MTTTIMKDSKIGDAWIRECATLNPVQRVIDPKTGQPNGNILTGPIRLAFCDTLFDPRAPTGNPNGKPKYGTMALYTPFTDFSIMYEEYYKVMAAKFASYYVAEKQQYFGVDSPFHDQAAKLKFGGFTPGLTYVNHTSSYMPQIVDVRGNVVTDRNKVKAGFWAILAVNPYDYGISPPQPRKGVAFGLQQVMMIAEDVPLAGGAPDPRVTFAGVNVKPPVVAPAANFGQAPPPGAPPQANIYPPHNSVPPGVQTMPPPSQMAPPPMAVDDTDISSLM